MDPLYSPTYYYEPAPVLINGTDELADTGILLVVFLILLVASQLLFKRRDLKKDIELLSFSSDFIKRHELDSRLRLHMANKLFQVEGAWRLANHLWMHS